MISRGVDLAARFHIGFKGLDRIAMDEFSKGHQTPPVGIVIPTLGTRPDFLVSCLNSVRDAGSAVVAISCPEVTRGALMKLGIEPDIWIVDPGGGAAAAINAGVSSFDPDVKFVGWIGDDDLLMPGSIDRAVFSFNPSTSAVYGRCKYVNDVGDQLFVNRSGRFAQWLMRIGPNLLPQPGSLVCRRTWDEIGGLDEGLKWTFDLDLFIKAGRKGKLVFIPEVLAAFRWHEDSLTAGSRDGSVREASNVRLRNMSPAARLFARSWEPVMRYLILRAGDHVSRKSERRSKVAIAGGN